MKLIVLGAGATGGYFGGRLSEAGADVTFLVRPARAQRLAADGLRIVSPDGDAALRPRLLVAGDASGPDRFDCAILGCKAYDLEAAIAALGPHLGAATMVLPLLNGLCHLDALDRAFGNERVIGGLCQISATLDADGTVRHLGLPPRILFGERAGGLTPRIEALAAAMAGAKFEARASDTIMQDLWEKFTLLAALAGGTCLMRATVGAIASTAGGIDFMRTMIAECMSVAAAAGHAPRENFRQRLMQVLTDPSSALAASMLRDIERGGPTEGDHVLGDMVTRAYASGIATPQLALAALHLATYERRRSGA